MNRVLCFLATLLFTSLLQGGETEIIAALKGKGAELTELKGVVTGLSFRDCSALTADDYAQMKQLTQVKRLSFGKGFNDESLKALAGMTTLESLSTNGMEVSDDGVRVLAACTGLRSIAFFHPGKRLKGAGLAALVTLPHLESLTVAGSAEFGDEGMAAIATITQLKNFRTWHTGVSAEGVKKLSTLKQLTSINLGQRLANAPPVTLSDAALPVLAELPLLEDVSLQEAPLTLNALSQLKKLSHLKRLTLEGIEIAESDLASLKQQLPDTRVSWTPPNEAAKRRISSLFK